MGDKNRETSNDNNPETAPPGTAASGFPEPPMEGDEDRSRDRDPHHALNNPVGEPDPTEWPDPYETREDPRGPDADPATGSHSTSEPHPSHDPEADRWEAPERDRLDQ
jgi:hypothetical protein